MTSEWLVLWAAAALLVRVGQLLGAMGMARGKNVASSGVRSLADLCIASLCFWAVGAAVLYQQPQYLIGWQGMPREWFAMLVLVLIGTGTFGPAVAERSRLRLPLIGGGCLAGLLIPLLLHWTRIGWLAQRGFIDTAGAAAIHVAPAICAAVAALFVGSREGKYNRDRSSNMIPGHNVSMVFTAVLLTLVGWIPYVVSASSGELSNELAANVILAAAAGGFVSLVIGQLRYGKVDVLLICSGILGGLVSITAAASHVSTPAAVLIGLIGGVLVPWMTVFIDMRFKIDDPGGVIAVHGVGGIWALIAAPIFAPDGFKVIGVQLLGIAVVVGASIVFAVILMLALRSFGALRARESDEFDGLDLAEHDINAHPDFQQTMIKSYHLREA